MGTAFDVLIQDCAQALAGTKVLTTQISSANSTVKNTIIVSGLSDTRSDASTARFEDTWARTLDGTTEWISKVMSFAANTPANSATLTVTPVRSASNHNVNVNVELHMFIHPTTLKDDCINKALRTMRHPVYYPLGLLTNPDMEDGTITTAWSEKASDKPKVEEETTATTAANVYRGNKSLKVTDSNVGDEYAYQATNVIGGQSLYVYGFGKTSVAATEAEFIPYDATTGAAIDTWDFDDLDWQETSGKIAIPATCKSFQVRLNVVTAAGVVYWDDVQCYYVDQREFVLPDWITSESQIGNVYYLPRGGVGPDEGYMVHQTELCYLDTPKILGNAGRFKIQFRGASIARPLYLACTRAYEELDADADVTTADRDTVVEGALHFAYKMKGSDFEEQAAEHGENWVAMRREPDYGVKWGGAFD